MNHQEQVSKEREMRQHVEIFNQSHLSRKQYCQQVGISVDSFYYWEKKFEYNQATCLKGNFLPMTIKEDQVKKLAKPIEIHYPNGVCISVAATTSFQLLRGLIRLI